MKQVIAIFIAAIFLIACKSGDKKANSTDLTKDNSLIQNAITPPDTANFTSIQWLDSTYLDLGKQKQGKEIEISFRLYGS